MEKTTNDLSVKYSKANRIIHWLTAFLIITLFPLGNYMAGIELDNKMGLIQTHAILGTLVFVLTIIRCILYFKSERPEDIKTGSKINDKLAVWVHNIFYFLLIGICISGIAVLVLGGYLDAFKSGNVENVLASDQIPPLKAHGFMAFITMLLLVVHIIGVIRHYVKTKENTLKRMI